MEVSLNENLFLWENNENIYNNWKEKTLPTENGEIRKYNYDLNKLIVGYSTYLYKNSSFDVWLKDITYYNYQLPIITVEFEYIFKEYYDKHQNYLPYDLESNLYLDLEINDSEIDNFYIGEFNKKGDTSYLTINLNDYQITEKSDEYEIVFDLYTLEGYKQVFYYYINFSEFIETDPSNFYDLTNKENSYSVGNVFSYTSSPVLNYSLSNKNYSDFEYDLSKTSFVYETNSNLVSEMQQSIPWVIKYSGNPSDENLISRIHDITGSVYTRDNDWIYTYVFNWNEYKNETYLVPRGYYYYNTLSEEIWYSEELSENFLKTIIIPDYLLNEEIYMDLEFTLDKEKYRIRIPIKFSIDIAKELTYWTFSNELKNKENSKIVSCYFNTDLIREDLNYYEVCS